MEKSPWARYCCQYWLHIRVGVYRVIIFGLKGLVQRQKTRICIEILLPCVAFFESSHSSFYIISVPVSKWTMYKNKVDAWLLAFLSAVPAVQVHYRRAFGGYSLDRTSSYSWCALKNAPVWRMQVVYYNEPLSWTIISWIIVQGFCAERVMSIVVISTIEVWLLSNWGLIAFQCLTIYLLFSCRGRFLFSLKKYTVRYTITVVFYYLGFL